MMELTTAVSTEGYWQLVEDASDIVALEPGTLLLLLSAGGRVLPSLKGDLTTTSCGRINGMKLKEKEEWRGFVSSVHVVDRLFGNVGVIKGLFTNGEETVVLNISSYSLNAKTLSISKWVASSKTPIILANIS